MPSFFFAPVVSKKKRVIGWGKAHGYRWMQGPLRHGVTVTPLQGEDSFLYLLRRCFFVSFLLFLLSQKKKQEKPDGKRKKKKGSAVSLGALEKRLFRIKCSDRFSSLRRDCGIRTPSANPTVPDLLVYLGGGGGRSLATRRENSGGCQHIGSVIRPLIAVKVAEIVCEHNRSLVAYRFFKNGGVQPTFLPALGNKPSVENPFI